MDERTDCGANLINALKSADDRAKYDNACKCILKERAVLAQILKATVAEYANCSLEDIADKFIEPDSISSETPVARNLTNINGLSEEDSTINEGIVKFDVKFMAKSPSDDKKSSVILYIDVEAQKKYSVGYPIEKRAAYYCARLLSSQIGNITENIDYNVLNKVYSVWICFDVPKKAANTVSRYHYTKEDLLGEFNNINESDYGLMETVIIRLSKDDTQIGNTLIDLLHSIFGDLACDEKLERLDKLGLNVESVRKEMTEMCNLSERILERGLEQGIEQGIEQGQNNMIQTMINMKDMHKKGSTIEEISKKLGLSIELIKKLI